MAKQVRGVLALLEGLQAGSGPRAQVVATYSDWYRAVMKHCEWFFRWNVGEEDRPKWVRGPTGMNLAMQSCADWSERRMNVDLRKLQHIRVYSWMLTAAQNRIIEDLFGFALQQQSSTMLLSLKDNESLKKACGSLMPSPVKSGPSEPVAVTVRSEEPLPVAVTVLAEESPPVTVLAEESPPVAAVAVTTTDDDFDMNMPLALLANIAQTPEQNLAPPAEPKKKRQKKDDSADATAKKKPRPAAKPKTAKSKATSSTPPPPGIASMLFSAKHDVD